RASLTAMSSPVSRLASRTAKASSVAAAVAAGTATGLSAMAAAMAEAMSQESLLRIIGPFSGWVVELQDLRSTTIDTWHVTYCTSRGLLVMLTQIGFVAWPKPGRAEPGDGPRSGRE